MLLCGNCIHASVQDVLNRADGTVRRVQDLVMTPFNYIYRILGTTGQDQEEDKRRTHITTQTNDGSEVIAIIRKQQPYSVGLVPHLNPAIQYSNKPIIAVPPENLYVPPSSGSQYPASSPGAQYNPSASQGTQDGCSPGVLQRLLKRRRRQVALSVVGALATPVAARFTKKFAGRLTTKLRERLNLGSTCGGLDGGNDPNAGNEGGGLFGGGGLTGRSGGALGRISSLLGGGNSGNEGSGLKQRLTGKLTDNAVGRLIGGGGSSGGSSGGLGLLGRLTGGGGSSDASSGGSSGGLLGGLTSGVMGLLGGGGSNGQAGGAAAPSGGGPLGFLGGLLG